MKPLRLVVFDVTDRGRFAADSGGGADGTSARGVGLSPIWRIGAQLFDAVGAFEAWCGAHTWAEALQFAIDSAARFGRPIDEIQAWGHGGFGFMRMGTGALDRAALGPASGLRAPIDALRDALAPDALVWLRCCSAFGHRDGHAFAAALAERLGARVAGHTHIIHALQSGTHSLAPGATPSWPVEEGVRFDGGIVSGALTSRPDAPNTMSFLRARLPKGY
jgi:hypothetical protein